jgi:hypothetical protein
VLNIRQLPASINRLLITCAMTLSLLAAIVVGSHHEAAAAEPMSSCARFLTTATSSKVMGDAQHAAGDYASAKRYYETALRYYALYNSLCF